jgi:hypothetical protein
MNPARGHNASTCVLAHEAYALPHLVENSGATTVGGNAINDRVLDRHHRPCLHHVHHLLRRDPLRHRHHCDRDSCRHLRHHRPSVGSCGRGWLVDCRRRRAKSFASAAMNAASFRGSVAAIGCASCGCRSAELRCRRCRSLGRWCSFAERCVFVDCCPPVERCFFVELRRRLAAALGLCLDYDLLAHGPASDCRADFSSLHSRFRQSERRHAPTHCGDESCRCRLGSGP